MSCHLWSGQFLSSPTPYETYLVWYFQFVRLYLVAMDGQKDKQTNRKVCRVAAWLKLRLLIRGNVQLSDRLEKEMRRHTPTHSDCLIGFQPSHHCSSIRPKWPLFVFCLLVQKCFVFGCHKNQQAIYKLSVVF